ncbi:MAG: hypothetical protein QOJ11_2303 [Frankiales bacterium]|jgi:uncharacterized protein (TIGR04255 family)|nr:hypothetical protein [Frankiales bacterium]
MTTTDALFSIEPVDEIHLGRAPLAKVLTQIQFSRNPQLVSDAAESAMAALLPQYPVRRQGVSANVTVGLTTVTQEQSPLRVYSDAADKWRVTVNESFVALETSTYETRDDFCSRVQQVLAAVEAASPPPIVDRVGLRYIDRIAGSDLSRINEYFTPSLTVLLGQVVPELTLEHSVSDTLIQLSASERLQVRSGFLPAGVGFDPSLVPLGEPAWLLDLDVFTAQGGLTFDPTSLTQLVRTFAQHAYSFFRYATTPTFQKAFESPASGGQS